MLDEVDTGVLATCRRLEVYRTRPGRVVVHEGRCHADEVRRAPLTDGQAELRAARVLSREGDDPLGVGKSEPVDGLVRVAGHGQGVAARERDDEFLVGAVEVEADLGNGELRLTAVHHRENREPAIDIRAEEDAQEWGVQRIGAGEPSPADHQDHGGAVARARRGQHVHR